MATQMHEPLEDYIQYQFVSGYFGIKNEEVEQVPNQTHNVKSGIKTLLRTMMVANNRNAA